MNLTRTLGIGLVATLATFAFVVTPAAAVCGTGGLACANAYGSGFLMNDETGCRLGDFFSSRTCIVQWSWLGSGSATLGGVLTVHLNADVTYTSGCAIPIAGSCSTGWMYTTVSYHVSCATTSVSASVDAQVTGLSSSPQDSTGMTVSLPPCN